jgi:curli biogenesis system outer membrane secretion channel CsgG
VAMEFGSKVNVDSSVERISTDSAFGHSMTQCLIAGLQQTEQLVILNPLGTRQKLAEQDLTSSGEMEGTALERISPLGGTEFWLAGELAVYQLSLESLKAGFAADPFFGNAQLNRHRGTVGPRVRAFGTLPVMSQDRIAINLRLIDVKR